MKVLAFIALLVCAVNAKSLQRVGDFSYNSCNTDAPIQVTALTVSPDPLSLPGLVTVSITVSGTEDVVSPTDFAVTLQKDVDGSWVDIPCVDGIGSCDTPDVCAALATHFPNGAGCPDAIVASGLNCNCPISAGTYAITDLVVDVTIQLPPSITNGDYHAGISVKDASGTEVSCVDIYASVVVAA